MNSSREQHPTDDFVPSRRWIYAFAVLALVSAYFCLDIRMDNRFDRMLNPSSVEAREYEDFVEMFGSDEFIIIGVSGKPIFDELALDVMLEALELLEKVPFVDAVNGIPTVYRDRFGAEDPEALADEILLTAFYHGVFISEDASIAGLLVDTAELAKPGDREILIDGLQQAIQPLRDYGFRVDMAGGSVFNVGLNKLSMKESFRIFPIAAVLSLIVLFAALRSFRAIATVVICGALTMLYTISLVGIAGRSLNVVTSMLPIILWVLAIANCIHLVCRYQYYRIDARDARDALNAALRDVRKACIVSAVTTAFGFVSLTLADIGPVAELGYLMSAGLIISLAVNLLLGSNLLLLMDVPAPRGKSVKRDGLFEAVGVGALRHRASILIAFGLLSIAGIYCTLQVRTDSNSLNFMPDDSEVVIGYKFILDNLTGTSALEIVIRTPGGWLNDEYWAPIQELQGRLSELAVVPRVMSPYEILKKIHQWDEDLDPIYYRLPDSGEDAQELLDMLEPEEKEGIRRYTAEDGETIRVTVMVNSMDGEDFARVGEIAQEEIAKLPEPLSAYTTGIGQRLDKMQARMASTQITTFSLAFVLVFICIFVGLGSMRAMLVAVLPNLVPILTVFMSMYLMGIALNAATVMVASIALGIAVDDTVHLLTAIHQEMKKESDTHTAIVRGMVKIGSSISITTATAAIGFFTLATSAFVPVSYFGLLSAIAMIMALIADFLLVPALYSITSPASKAKDQTSSGTT